MREERGKEKLLIPKANSCFSSDLNDLLRERNPRCGNFFTHHFLQSAIKLVNSARAFAAELSDK
jgi:hypothetical protein